MLLLETGDRLLLEDGIGRLLLEDDNLPPDLVDFALSISSARNLGLSIKGRLDRNLAIVSSRDWELER